MDIRKHIKELLFTHDCVIIPGFGGFVTSYQPSEIQRFKNVIYPPSKSILFNKRLQTNDGVLITRIAQQEQIDYKAAEEQVRKSADAWTKLINNKGMLLFPDIGKLFINSANALVFLPELRKNYLTDTFGLKPIAFHAATETTATSTKLVKMERKTPPKIEEFAPENENEYPDRNKRSLRIAMVATAATILLLLIPQLFLQDMLPENIRVHQLNLMPLIRGEKADEPATAAESKEKKEVFSPAEESTADETSVPNTAAEETPAPPEALSDQSLPASGNFYIVFAEAGFISDAIRMKKQLDSEHAQTFEVFSGDGGNYVVGLKAGDSQQEAQASLNTYSSGNSDLKLIVRE